MMPSQYNGEANNTDKEGSGGECRENKFKIDNLL